MSGLKTAYLTLAMVSFAIPVTAQELAEKGDFVVHDLVILEGSAFSSGFSGRDRFRSTLPRSAAGRRAASEARGRPMPMGLITFSGEPTERVDVLLEHSGTGVASVPPANVRKGRLLWSSLDLKPEAKTLPIFEGSWLKPLLVIAETSDKGLLAVRGNSAMAALIYDVETDGKPTVGLRVNGDSWAATNSGRRGVEHVAVFRPAGEGLWKTAVLPVLASAPDEKQAAETTSPAEDVLEGGAKDPDGKEAGDEKKNEAAAGLLTGLIKMAVGSTDEATTNSGGDKMPVKAAQDATPKEAPVSVKTLSFGKSADRETTATEYADSLPNLSPAGRAYTAALIALRLADDHSLLIYRLSAEEHTRLFPLEVTPAATRVERTALLLVQDADPSVIERIDTLIQNLGSLDWSEREAAHAELRRLGRVAEPKLEQAKSNKDPEIADRATRLITEIGTPVEEAPQPVQADVMFF